MPQGPHKIYGLTLGLLEIKQQRTITVLRGRNSWKKIDKRQNGTEPELYLKIQAFLHNFSGLDEQTPCQDGEGCGDDDEDEYFTAKQCARFFHTVIPSHPPQFREAPAIIHNKYTWTGGHRESDKIRAVPHTHPWA